MLIVFAVTLIAYVYTMPRTVVLEDDGEFIMAVYFMGIAHPPGYPLFVLLSHPFTWLPVGSVAFRVHLASGFYGAATCAVLWWVVRALIPNRGAAYAGALGLGFSQVFWSQAIIAEVYTLNTLLFFSIFGACLLYLHSRRPPVLHGIALLFGLSLSNHWPLIVLASPCLLLVLWPALPSILRQLPKALPTLLLALAVGLSPYLWMVFRSRGYPDLSFYGAIDSWSEFWYTFSREGYSQVDESPSAGLWDKAQFAGFLARELLAQYTPLGALLAAIGFVAQWRVWRPSLSIGLIAGFLTGSFGLLLMLDFDYELLRRAILKVYPLIPYGILALWLALGFDRTLEALRARLKTSEGWLGYPAAAVLAVAVMMANLPTNNRRDHVFALDYGRTLLDSFDPGALVLTHGDLSSNVLGYLHYVEGQRPDIRLLNDSGLAISPGGRLFDPIDTPDRQIPFITNQYVINSSAPVYTFSKIGNFSTIYYGLYLKIDKSSEGRLTMQVDDRLVELFRRIEEKDDHRDLWTIASRNGFVGDMTTLLTAVVHRGRDPVLAERYREDLARGSDHFSGLLKRISYLAKPGRVDPDQLMQWIDQAEALVDDTVAKRDHALLYLFKGRLLKRLARLEEAKTAFGKSVEIYPHPGNEARRELTRF